MRKTEEFISLNVEIKSTSKRILFWTTVIVDEKQEEKWKERQVLGTCQRTKKAMEHGGDGDTTCNWCTWNGF